jgi:predicted Zn-dependent peptidase
MRTKKNTVIPAFAGMTAVFFFAISFAHAAAPAVQIAPLDFKPAQAERTVLKNGVVVYLKEDHELPLFDLQMYIHVSPADEPVHDAFDFLGDVWRSGGTTSRTPEQLNQQLERMPASVETSANDEALSLSVSSLSRDMDAALNIFSDVLLHPAFRLDQIELHRSKSLEALRRKNETPSQIARRAFRDVVYGKAHIYAYEPTTASLSKVQRKHLLALHKKTVVPDQAVIAVAGDFNKEQLLATLERLFENWKPSGRTVPAYDYSVTTPSPGRVFFIAKDSAQSRITIAHLGPSRHAPDHFPLSVANYILGGGGPSRLFGEIRSRLGLAYVVGSFALEFKGPGLVGVGCQTKSASSVAAAQAILEQLKKFADGPVSADELSLAKDSLTNSYLFNFDTPIEVAAARAQNEFYGFSEDYIDIYAARLADVTNADVVKAARTYFAPGSMKIMIVGNDKKFDTPLSTLGAVTVIPLDQVN